jgi:pyruvate ferredoxin oxidoreductase gamma subunit
MYRIRFHGRGGQGLKTASRILGSAFFFEGFEVQDAPRYGAERRGAPIFAFVRASTHPVFERGVIRNPDLVLVADESLVCAPAAGVLQGLDERSLLLIVSAQKVETWRRRLDLEGPVLCLTPRTSPADDVALIGAACAGAAARLVGAISRGSLEAAIRAELKEARPEVIERNVELTLAAFDEMAPHAGRARQAGAAPIACIGPPDWIDLEVDTTVRAAPVIRGGPNSGRVETGLWRQQRPVIDYEQCHGCIWICGPLCPDGAIRLGDEHQPLIDYEHCKGCLVCASICPWHAIEIEPETSARRERPVDAVREGAGR